MNYLYLITEDDNDDLFFEGCLERITGLTFTLDQTSRRLRPGDGDSAVRRTLLRLLNKIEQIGKVDDVYLVIAIDNDRAPTHPEHEQLSGLGKADQRRTCRICNLQEILESKLGSDASTWPIKVAIAVPVEMLESWLLIIRGAEPSTLPIFGSKSKPSAKKYYDQKKIPDQLKELCTIEIQNSSCDDMADFCLECATELLDPNDLAKKSPSFTHFKDQVERWS